MTNGVDSNYSKLLRDIPIAKIIGCPEKIGKRFSINCPFHIGDKTPSCSININNTFYCFGCGKKGGGSIDFVMALGSTFKEACKELEKYIE